MARRCGLSKRLDKGVASSLIIAVLLLALGATAIWMVQTRRDERAARALPAGPKNAAPAQGSMSDRAAVKAPVMMPLNIKGHERESAVVAMFESDGGRDVAKFAVPARQLVRLELAPGRYLATVDFAGVAPDTAIPVVIEANEPPPTIDLASVVNLKVPFPGVTTPHR